LRITGGGDNGDDAWRVWLDRHGPALLLYARQWCRTRADSEDAVQDAFVRFWKSRGRARDETAYLFACVRTAALDLARGGERRKRHEAAASIFECSPPERDHWREAVEAALEKLPAEQREVLVLKIWGGLTFAQIAEMLAIPMSTAASRHRYALERLEALLAKEVVRD
jgi:RNA polymerase sigma-70 factor (ECF subfamily)